MKRAGISLLLFVMQRLELLEAGRTDNIDVGNWRMEGRAQENSTIVVFFLSVAVASVVTMVSTVNRRTFAGSSGRSRFGTVSSSTVEDARRGMASCPGCNRCERRYPCRNRAFNLEQRETSEWHWSQFFHPL